MNKNKEGVCPYCGSSIVIYSTMYWDDEKTIVQECNCETCGEAFDEIYNANYDHTETYDEN